MDKNRLADVRHTVLVINNNNEMIILKISISTILLYVRILFSGNIFNERFYRVYIIFSYFSSKT